MRFFLYNIGTVTFFPLFGERDWFGVLGRFVNVVLTVEQGGEKHRCPVLCQSTPFLFNYPAHS
jgi:hypothetical protein